MEPDVESSSEQQGKSPTNPQPIHTSQYAQDVLDQTEMIHQEVRKNAMQAYIKYKAYYDKKANASKLKALAFL